MEEETKISIIDFCKGLFGVYLITVIFTIIVFFVDDLGLFEYEILDMFVWGVYILNFILWIVLSIYTYKLNRRWLFYGVITSVVIPIIFGLLFFGACFIAFQAF